MRVLAKIPTMLAAFHMIRRGQDPIQPRDDLPYASNFLYMLTEREPDPLAARIFDACLVLHAEHTLNASTFSARVTASTLTDPYAVVASAVGTLAGPLHGGANEDVLLMLEEIGSEDRVEGYLDEAIASKRKIMGFGHREYKVKDPRATILQGIGGNPLQPLWARPHVRRGSPPGKPGRREAGPQGHLPECGFLFRAGVSQARHPHRSVHAGLCALSRCRLARPLERTAGRQPDLPADSDLYGPRNP